MQINIKNKRILVTGSSSGIGKGILHSFNQHGALTVANSRNKDSLDESVKSYKNCFTAHGDVSIPDDAKKVVISAIDKLGGLDTLVCNVGSGVSVQPGNESYDEWIKVFHANFFSATNVIENSIDALSKSNGNIICISSICGSQRIDGAPVTYSVAKSALNAYIKSISKFLGNKGIRINGIAPGNILFEGSIWEKKIADNKSSVDEMLNKDVPLKMLGDLEDISNLALYISSDKSKFLHGSVIEIDGGQTTYF